MSPTVPKAKRRAPARPSQAPRSSSTFDFLLLAASALAGVGAWFACTALYERFRDEMSAPVLIGGMFGVLLVMVAVAVLICSRVSGAGGSPAGLGGAIGRIPAGFVLLVLVALGAALFQWLYGLNLSSPTGAASSYIFVIDDSGSMADSDPEGKRYSAIGEVLGGAENGFPYMVYGFSDDTSVLLDMRPASEGVPELSGEDYGGTCIMDALTQVLDDRRAGAWAGGEYPKVILLTDGYATDVKGTAELDRLLSEYRSENISIGAVGLGSADRSLMTRIAEATGGTYVDVSDASQLGEALTAAATEQADRDLVSRRFATGSDALYGLMRVLFLTLLGIGIGAASAELYGYREAYLLIIVSSAVKSLLGGLIMEFGSRASILPDGALRAVLWLLIAAVIAVKPTAYRQGGRKPPISSSSRSLRY